MVIDDIPIIVWPPSVKPWRHILKLLFLAWLAHPETAGAHWPYKQNVTLIYYLVPCRYPMITLLRVPVLMLLLLLLLGFCALSAPVVMYDTVHASIACMVE